MALTFEWDTDKAESNLRKHGISFEEASTVFGDLLSRTIDDPAHSSSGEQRFVTIGRSHQNRLIVIAHCERIKAIRIIMARSPTPSERRDYEN